MKKLLITGGPVYAKLDDVKIITNRFKGGLIANLVDLFISNYNSDELEVIYLCSKESVLPKSHLDRYKLIYHDGFDDYFDLVKQMTPNVDGIVLGAAVANLIPLNPIDGKFPSHNYKPGDIIPIQFTIAPRVIDAVKKINPNVNLFGFKLLSNVDHNELIDAAYGVLLESKAIAVFANDTNNLLTKHIVTREREEIESNNIGIVKFIWDRIHDEYYHTVVLSDKNKLEIDSSTNVAFDVLVERYKKFFTTTKEGFVFGTIAVKNNKSGSFDKSFLTTSRYKRVINDKVLVFSVSNDRTKTVYSSLKKPTLNAPLLSNIFTDNENVYAVVHFHFKNNNKSDWCFPDMEYAVPGTVKDSQRNVKTSFVVNGHGVFLLLDKNLNIIV